MTYKARMEIRLHEDDREAFKRAVLRSGDRSESAFLLRVGRIAARELLRTASATMARARTSVLVGAVQMGPVQLPICFDLSNGERPK